MTASRHLFMVGLGLCLVVSYVHPVAGGVKVYGNDPSKPFEDFTWQLDKKRTEKQNLEQLLEKATNPTEIKSLKKSLEMVTAELGKMQSTFRVVYRDHIEAMKDKTQHFEEEKVNMKKELEAAEKQHAQALADMQEARKKDVQQIAAYQAKLEESTNNLEKLERDYAVLKEIQTEELEKEKEEKEQLIKVRNELTEKLQNAQDLHSKAMEALSMSLSQPPVLPYENEINELKQQLIALINTNDENKRLVGLTKLQEAVDDLYDVLYKESKLPRNVVHEDLEDALNVMKSNTKETKSKQSNLRNILVDQIQKKKLEDYTETEIEALQKANQDVATADIFLREIARRKDYLKSIKQLAFLIEQIQSCG